LDGGSVHSEGPIWDRHHGVVRWVDTFAGDDLERGMLRRSDVGLHLGALATTVEGQLLAAAGDGFYEIGERLVPIATPPTGKPVLH
jgi:hypothetical protein